MIAKQGKRRKRDRNVSLFVGDMVQHVARIKKCTENLQKEEFLTSIEKQSVVMFSLIVIGEAARSITFQDVDEQGKPFPLGADIQEFKNRNPELWEVLVLAGDARNVLVHEYFRVDLDIVWNTVKNFLPRLEKLLEAAAG